MAKPSKLKIKNDLLDQLERKCVYGQHFIDLINDYVALWEIKNLLIKDIKERGVSIRWQTFNRDGDLVQEGWKKNDSIAELNKTNAQMLKILKELGIEAKAFEPDPEVVQEM